MPTTTPTRVSWLLNDAAELEAAQAMLDTHNDDDENANSNNHCSSSSSMIKSVSIALGHPSLVREHHTTLKTLFASVSALPSLEEVRLSFLGVGKGGTPDENSYQADALAELIRIAALGGNPNPNPDANANANASSSAVVSLELAVSNLQGSLESLASAIQSCSALERVIIHQCDSDTPQGLLPLIAALSQMGSLKTLIIENVKFPVGDNNDSNMTANALLQLASNPSLSRLELKQCVDLTDEALIPLVSALKTLKHLKLSTGFFQPPNRRATQWGHGVMAALAKNVSHKSCALVNLAVTTTPEVSLLPLVQAMETNTSVKRLTLYNGANSKDDVTSMHQEMMRILTHTNMTLEHCNHLGGCTFGEYQDLCFYTKLNQWNRRELWNTDFASNNNTQSNNNKWLDLLLKEENVHSSNDDHHRLYYYVLSNNPAMIPSTSE